MPAGREWVTPSSHTKKKKVKFTKPTPSAEPSRGNAPSSTSAKPAAPASATNPFAVLGEGNTSSGNSPEKQVTAEDSSTREHSSVTMTEPPDSSNLEVEEGEVGSGDADIPDSVARALLDALQEKRMGNQLPAAMAPLARIRASQLQKCISDGTEPQETVIQAALDLIATDKGPSDPAALADKVLMVSQMPDVQTNATLPAQGSSSTINTTACAEVTANPLYEAITRDNHSNPIARVPDPTYMGHHANSFRMSANDVPEQLVLYGASEDVPAILAQFRKRVELKGDLHVPPSEIDSRAVRFLPLLLKSVALETYSQLTLGTLEWRSENTLSNLKLHRMNITPVAPRSWSDWVEALTAMFAPPNLLANLCRDIATLRQRDEKHPGENVDQYALRISSLFTRLLTEAARTRPMENLHTPLHGKGSR